MPATPINHRPQLNLRPAKYDHLLLIVCVLLLSLTSAQFLFADGAPPEPREFKFQITGLFSPERVADLRQLFAEQLPMFTLLSIDYENAEITVQFEPAEAYPNYRPDQIASPEQILELFNNTVGIASRRTFGIKPLRAMPLDQLTRIEIGILGLDCKACSLAVYEYVAKLDGVEMATASFKDGKVTAWINPAQIDQKAIEETLTKRNVPLASDEE